MATSTRFDKLKAAVEDLVNFYRSNTTLLKVTEKLEKIEWILNEAEEDSEEEARLILSVAQWFCIQFRQAFPQSRKLYDVYYKPLISISKRLKIIIWLLCARIEQKVGEFYFPLTVDPLFTIKIDNETILKHSMSVKSVIELLDLSPNTSPKKRATDIFVNRTEVCSEHLMYCTVALTTEQLSKLEENVSSVMYKNVIQNRYGCAVVKFRIQPYLNKESVKFFNLGTKQFFKECMQMVLVHDEESIDSSPWKVFCESKNRLDWFGYTIDQLQRQKLDLEEFKEIKPIADFEWGLKYTENNWTHPTFIFVNEIKFPEFLPKSDSQKSIPEFELEFEVHRCIKTKGGRRKLCLDCKLFRNDGQQVYVTKVEIINNQETFSNVSVSISQYIKITDQCNCSPEFGIFLFAMSLHVSNREEFLEKVEEGRYIVKQLEQIKEHWKNAPNFYYTDWRESI